MNTQAVVGLALKASIMLTLFGFGLQANREDLLYLWRKPRLLVLSLAAMFVVMPLFALLITHEIHFDAIVVIALLALSASPVPPLLPKKVTKAGGVSPFGLGLMVIAATFSIVYVPLASYLIGKYFNRPFAMGPVAIAKLIGLSVLVPLAAGIVFRKFAPELGARLAQPIIKVAGIVLLVGSLCILAFAFSTAWSFAKNGTIPLFAGFVLVGLLVGHLSAGPDQDERTTLALCTACRHPGLATAVAGTYVSKEDHVFGAILLYLIINVILTAAYVAWQRIRLKTT